MVIFVYLDTEFNKDFNLPLYNQFISLYNDCKYFNFCPICTNQLKHEFDYSYCESHDFKIADAYSLFSFEDYSTDGKTLLDNSNNESIPLNSIISDHNNLSLIKIINAITKYAIFK